MMAPPDDLQLLTLSAAESKPLLVFLPGMDGAGSLYQDQVAGLAAHFDLRAVSIPTDDRRNWSQLAQRVAELLRAVQAVTSRPMYVCGESFGGCLALQLAVQVPAVCDGLILVNPASSFSRLTWLHWAARPVQWLPASLYRFSALGLLPFLINPDRVSAANQQKLLQAMQAISPEAAAWRLELLSRFNFEALPLAQIRQPTLVITATADRLLPSAAEALRLARALPRAQTVTLPDSGHACLLETEVQLGEILRDQAFLIAPSPATRL